MQEILAKIPLRSLDMALSMPYKLHLNLKKAKILVIKEKYQMYAQGVVSCILHTPPPKSASAVTVTS